jgi:hypothetical protein
VPSVLPAALGGYAGNDIVQNRRLTCQILLILPRDARTRIETSPPAVTSGVKLIKNHRFEIIEAAG